MTAELLLGEAQAVLDGEDAGRNRTACWLARASLEEAIRERLTERDCPPGEASMRSLLTCLEIAYSNDPEWVNQAEQAWAGLSNACHHHAFQLGPTSLEAQRLIDSVRVIATTPPTD
ncbi:hypothetical protein N802_10235 [Knoellia sinensis KCTC 19936]|uniref:Uncharacterized protein n=1 Tax=Knoellia sinensis KCTC 19936 TaxID=1385520 RepID=A0A0A0IYP2_9MICO|nr:hypothetical protein N802_10235 [Knoellia sinensis KCTC 19936]